MWHSRPVSTPPPFMANTILNFHFDYWNPSLRWYSPGRRWRVSSSTTFPRCSKPRTPVCSLWSRWVSSFRVSRFLALLDTQREKCRPNFNNNFYHRTRRRGTNCPPDHRMENTLAKGPASRGQMWSDCFVFKSAADQCGHIDFSFLKSSRRKRGQNAFWTQLFLQIRCKIKRIQ